MSGSREGIRSATRGHARLCLLSTLIQRLSSPLRHLGRHPATSHRGRSPDVQTTYTATPHLDGVTLTARNCHLSTYGRFLFSKPRRPTGSAPLPYPPPSSPPLSPIHTSLHCARMSTYISASRRTDLLLSSLCFHCPAVHITTDAPSVTSYFLILHVSAHDFIRLSFRAFVVL